MQRMLTGKNFWEYEQGFVGQSLPQKTPVNARSPRQNPPCFFLNSKNRISI